MPTRTEVIQALKARDVFREEDYALLLDYLEQEASSLDAGIRSNAILRHHYDVVDLNTIERIYDYVASLGAASLTKREFLRGIRTRDNVSRRLINYIMDLVDGGAWSFPLNSQASHWWDATDISSLYQTIIDQDVGEWVQQGGTPVTADGQTVVLAKDKGYPISSRLDLFTSIGPFYDDDIITAGTLTSNGAARGIGTSQAGDRKPPPPVTLPVSFGVVFELTDVTNSGFILALEASAAGFICLGGSSQIRFDNYGDDTVFTTAISNNVTYACFGTIRADATWEAWANWQAGSISGTSPLSGLGTQAAWGMCAADQSGNIDIIGGVAEAMVWNGYDDSDGREAAFETYTASKYGIAWA